MKLNKLCRTCLSASENMQSLYETCANSTQVCFAEMLNTFTPLICFESDGLPAQICHNCIGELNRLNAYRLKCLESDTILQTYLENEVETDENQIVDEVLVKYEPPLTLENSFETLNEHSNSEENSLHYSNQSNTIKDEELDIIKHELDVDIKMEREIYEANEHDEAKSYSCAACNKTFKTKYHLDNHMRTHTNEKPFSCTDCNVSFKHKDHQRTHTGAKHFICTICSSSFKQNHYLRAHMRIHSREKSHLCSECNIAFSRIEGLRSHMRTHTGEKPFACLTCGRQFNTKHQLTCHMRIHTGEKPYTCTDCNISFSRVQNLKIHLQKHMDENTYSCTMCNMSYMQKRHLLKHMKMHPQTTD